MANAWPTPDPSTEHDDTVASRSEHPEERNRGIPYPASASQVVDSLRASITGSQQKLDTLLSGVTLAAYALTRATGAALALWTQSAVICRASVGDTAPPVGATLDQDSGISGECLRTGAAQLCLDVVTDPRVDGEACRQLGIQSLAAVPLQDQTGVTGVLEVFSDQPHSFTDSHIALLKQLAEIAVSHRHPRSQTNARPPADPNPEDQARNFSEPNVVRPSPLPKKLELANRDRRWLKPVASGIAGIAVLISFGWLASRAFRASTSPGSVGKAGVSVQDVRGSRGIVEAVSSPTGSAANGVEPVDGKPSAKLDTAPNDLVVRASSTTTLHRTLPLRVVIPGKALGPTSEGTRASADELNPPEASQLLGDQQNSSVHVAGLVISSVQMPQVQVSQGVTGGMLVHRVDPTYPKLARVQKIEGTVGLQAIVGEDGSLHELKVVSGDAVLARAAQQAVAQWRYVPYQLNGKPVSMRTDITVQFKLPQ